MICGSPLIDVGKSPGVHSRPRTLDGGGRTPIPYLPSSSTYQRLICTYSRNALWEGFCGPWAFVNKVPAKAREPSTRHWSEIQKVNVDSKKASRAPALAQRVLGPTGISLFRCKGATASAPSLATRYSCFLRTGICPNREQLV
jgi:hypothetical protein